MSALDTILQHTRRDLAARWSPDAVRDLIALAFGRAAPRSLEAALRRAPGAPPRVIAELKKASPSRGLIRADFRARELALSLEAAGAAALSVLTEPHFFMGSPETLQEVASVVGIPLLRKDFIVDELQLLEARAWGASAVLLIAAALTPASYRRLYRGARGMGLEVLTEVHARDELGMVLDAGAHMVGVNSRNLKTLEVDLAVTEALLAEIPAGLVRVAESGIHTRDDLRRLQAAGADAFLIGETLMRRDDPADALRELLRDPEARPDGCQP